MANFRKEGEIIKTKDNKNAKILGDYFIITFIIKELENKKWQISEN